LEDVDLVNWLFSFFIELVLEQPKCGDGFWRREMCEPSCCVSIGKLGDFGAIFDAKTSLAGKTSPQMLCIANLLTLHWDLSLLGESASLGVRERVADFYKEFGL
jgi:hypothetical protein